MAAVSKKAVQLVAKLRAKSSTSRDEVVAQLVELGADAVPPLLKALEQSFRRRNPLAVATILEGVQVGHRAFAGLEPGQAGDASHKADDPLQDQADLALARRSSMEATISVQGSEVRVWTEFRPARPGLWIFGAGDDAQPLLRLAKELGWYVTVADGRSQLTTRERFPLADELHALQVSALPANKAAAPTSALANLHTQDAAVMMTHSFEQDSRVLASLLSLEAPLAYIGVLGPQRRTRELITEAIGLLGLPADPTSSNLDPVERWLARLHAPTGLDLGAESPETIALSVVAEIQKSFTRATALPLREVRAAAPANLR